jgi:hypothetical protein
MKTNVKSSQLKQAGCRKLYLVGLFRDADSPTRSAKSSGKSAAGRVFQVAGSRCCRKKGQRAAATVEDLTEAKGVSAACAVNAAGRKKNYFLHLKL